MKLHSVFVIVDDGDDGDDGEADFEVDSRQGCW